MFDELKTFIAVVEYNSFTKAAKSINLSQPGVSLHIRNLEKYFNARLIQRSIKQKNIVITTAGKMVYERSKQLVKLMEDTRQELQEYTNEIRGKLRIGASFTIGEYFLPEFLGEFSRVYPELKLEVAIDNTAGICKRLAGVELDVGLIEGMVPEGEFEHGNFYKDKMVLAVPYRHPLTEKPFCSEYLQNQTWISREEGSGTREYLNFFLNSNNIIPKNIIVFGSNYSVKEAVKNHLGITFISSYVALNAANNKEISIIQTNQDYTRNFSYIIPKGTMPTRAVKALIDNLIKEK